MQITKYTHACVRLSHEGRVLVIDPGVWSEPEALLGADAVLVTHEHADHVNVRGLAGLGVPVYAPADSEIPGMEAAGIDLVRVTSGAQFLAAGFRVHAVGARHALIHGGEPDCANLGYIVEGAVYHPGDALHVPEQEVETLLVPVQGSWLKLGESIDFVTAVEPKRTFAIHDAQLSDRGLAGVSAWLAEKSGNRYEYLAPGETR